MTNLMKFVGALWLTLGISGLSLSVAAEQAGAASKGYPAGSEAFVKRLKATIPDLPIESVYPIPVNGMFAVELPGGETLYGTKDGKYMFSGDLYSLEGRLVNLAEGRRAVKRKQLLAAEPLEDMVIFSPAGETKAHINVFTDVDCGYCRKLHQEIADINALGIEVRYLAYPRAGLGTPTHAKIVAAWCADDRREAMTALKSGLKIPMSECENPISHQYELGQQVGVTGTPSIVTADGQLLPGYMPAARLAEVLGI